MELVTKNYYRMRLPSQTGFLLCCMAIHGSLMAQPSPAKGIYTCTDAAGKRFTADRPISQCADREQRVLGPSGIERSRVGPVLTEIEMAQRLEQERQKQRLEQRGLEQRKRDAALLARYPEPKSHAAARRSALAQVEELQALAQQQMLELNQSHQQLQQELAFYVQDPSRIPARLRGSVQEVEKAQVDQREVLAGHAHEAQRIEQRFDAELARLQPLWASQD